MLRHINLRSNSRVEMIDITSSIHDELKDAGFENGICHLHVPHTTAGITINEGADPSVRHDLLATLNRLIPKDPAYRHAEGNSDAHVKSTLVGVNLSIIVDEGALVLGTWQAVYFCEFDGPRHRRVTLKFSG